MNTACPVSLTVRTLAVSPRLGEDTAVDDRSRSPGLAPHAPARPRGHRRAGCGLRPGCKLSLHLSSNLRDVKLRFRLLSRTRELPSVVTSLPRVGPRGRPADRVGAAASVGPEPDCDLPTVWPQTRCQRLWRSAPPEARWGRTREAARPASLLLHSLSPRRVCPIATHSPARDQQRLSPCRSHTLGQTLALLQWPQPGGDPSCCDMALPAPHTPASHSSISTLWKPQ